MTLHRPNRIRTAGIPVALLIGAGLLGCDPGGQTDVGRAMSGSRDVAYDTRVKSELRDIATSLEAYAMSNNDRWPTDEQGLDALETRLPIDPWGNPYQYRATARTTMQGHPELFSMGPDGEPGTDDDIHHEWSGR